MERSRGGTQRNRRHGRIAAQAEDIPVEIQGSHDELGMKLEVGTVSLLLAGLGGLGSGLLGALYPALRAAGQDAVEALNFE